MFKSFKIERPVFIPSKEPSEEYFKYNFSLVKEENGSSFVVGHLKFNKKEAFFEFSSCGLRYLEHRVDGLEEWIIAWCKMKTLEILAEE